MSAIRKEWEDRAAKLGSRFVLDTVAASLNDDLLRRAKSLHDTMFSGKSAKGAGGADGAKNPQHVQVRRLFVSVFVLALLSVHA